MRGPARWWVGAAAVALSCGRPPVYRSDLGLTGQPSPAGSLAGSYGLRVVAPAVVDAPLIGKQAGGGETWYLVERRWDGRRYSQRAQQCGGVVYDTGGAKAFISNEARRRIPWAPAASVEVDHETGAFRVVGHLELWGIGELPEPYDTALPRDGAEAARSPHVERLRDTDEDGHPGITAQVRSFVSGEQYFVHRRVMDLDGLVQEPGRQVGLHATTIEQVTIGASHPLLDQQSTLAPHPDPRRSWFEERRLPQGAGCDEVQAWVDEGALGGRRPFQ